MLVEFTNAPLTGARMWMTSLKLMLAGKQMRNACAESTHGSSVLTKSANQSRRWRKRVRLNCWRERNIDW